MTRFESACEKYAAVGVDVQQALETLQNIPISLHCWQGDDVLGFDGADALSGGIQTTGNYPGRARTPQELMADIEKAISLMPGKKRLNLHASYAFLGDDKGKLDRDAYEPRHFAPWVEFAKRLGLDGIDFNPTFFGHPMVKNGLTLSSPDSEVRAFWVRHGIACRRIARYFAEEMGSHCLVNVWIPDGLKDVPADRLSPRIRLRQSLDEIFAEKLPGVVDAVESKVFGIGVESYTVGSNEFYQNYAATRGICCLLDNGHYHPTEVVSDKIPSLLAFHDKIALHVTRGVRWDSDHVVLLEDELKQIAVEIVRNDAVDKVLIGLDYFDASINRIGAWVTGQRSMEKALLYALLQPHDVLRAMQDNAEFGKLMYTMEQQKLMPLGDIWEEYLRRQGLSEDWYGEIENYESEVLEKRA
ncbi:MAG: L-rhamnose isomerase [Acutalibacteraceae bacterium]